MKKIYLSLGIIAIVAIGAVGATRAFFSDTETSTGNTFTAGAIDLKIDSQQHYNNAICVAGKWQLEQGASLKTPQYPVIGSDCGGAWELKDLMPTSDRFFAFDDIKPGDSGENTISLHVSDNDAYVCAYVSNLVSNDNSQTEPESEAIYDTDDMTSGELDNKMVWKIWRDDGDNIWESGEAVLAEGHPSELPEDGVLPLYDWNTGTGPLAANTPAYLGVSWSLSSGTGNETQTDSLSGDISFEVVQSRNNAGFVCSRHTELKGSLFAQDFGVMDFSNVTGYSAGFGVTDATLAGATSVVVKLYSAGDILMQTNTAIIPQFNADITGTQFSSPFDVNGSFDYVADGYWTNVRAAEYGQNVLPTKVVATVTLSNGKVVTAENTILTGDTNIVLGGE